MRKVLVLTQVLLALKGSFYPTDPQAPLQLSSSCWLSIVYLTLSKTNPTVLAFMSLPGYKEIETLFNVFFLFYKHFLKFLFYMQSVYIPEQAFHILLLNYKSFILTGFWTICWFPGNASADHEFQHFSTISCSQKVTCTLSVSLRSAFM